jgi:thiamine kinase-like enzyme
MEVTHPRLLRSTNNTVVWLQPSPVVAKVAPSSNSQPEWEFVVASALGRIGAPAVPPLELGASAVHYAGRWTVTFWPYHAQTGVAADPIALGAALEHLHRSLDAAARREGWSLPDWEQGPRDVMTRLNDETFAPALNSEDRRLLIRVLARSHEVAEASAAEHSLHGSPHGFNVLMVDDKPMFIDFETVCHGPVEWDLSHLEPSAASQYPRESNVEALALARVVVSAMTAALCWEGIDRGEDMRSHAEHHLAVVRGALG